MFGRGTDEFDADGLTDFSEVGVLGKKPITGMNGVRPGNLSRTQYIGNISITEGSVCWPDADFLIGCANVEARSIGLGENRDGLDTELFAGPNHTECNLTAIGY